MNATDVYKEVAALCSEGRIDSDKAFYASLNRAISEVGRLDPMKKTVTVRHFPPVSVYRLTAPCTVSPDAPLSVSTLWAEAFALSGWGRGILRVFGEGSLLEEILLEGDGGFVCRRSSLALCGKKKAELTLCFMSRSTLVLDSLALYEQLAGDDIPLDGKWTVYDMTKQVPRFMGFSGDILKNKTTPLEEEDEVIFDEEKLRLASCCRGVYEIGYYEAPATVTEDNAEDALSIREALLHLVPLLTAYYCCVEDENPKASAFLARYGEAVQAYKERNRLQKPCAVRDVYGW